MELDNLGELSKVFVPLFQRITGINGTKSVLPADPARLSLLVTLSVATGTTLFTLGPPGGQCFEWLAQTGTIYEFTWSSHGDIATAELWINTTAPSLTYSIATLRRQ